MKESSKKHFGQMNFTENITVKKGQMFWTEKDKIKQNNEIHPKNN